MLTLLRLTMDKVCRALEWVLALSFTGMIAVIFLQVFCRFVLGTGFAWSEELARYLFVVLSMGGTVIAVYRKENLGIEFIVDKLPPNGKRVVGILVDCGCLVLFGHIAYYGYKILPIVGRQTSAALAISMAIPYSTIAISGLLMSLATVLSIISRFDCRQKEQP